MFWKAVCLLFQVVTAVSEFVKFFCLKKLQTLKNSSLYLKNTLWGFAENVEMVDLKSRWGMDKYTKSWHPIFFLSLHYLIAQCNPIFGFWEWKLQYLQTLHFAIIRFPCYFVEVGIRYLRVHSPNMVYKTLDILQCRTSFLI